MKLADASVAKQNAAFNAIFPDLNRLVGQYVPPFFQSEVLDKLNSPAGRAMVVRLIDEGLNAAENVP